MFNNLRVAETKLKKNLSFFSNKIKAQSCYHYWRIAYFEFVCHFDGKKELAMIVLNRRQLVILSFAVFNDSNLFTAGMIACLLGLRHACDADHIGSLNFVYLFIFEKKTCSSAAIDNVTRRLAFLQQDSLLVRYRWSFVFFAIIFFLWLPGWLLLCGRS